MALFAFSLASCDKGGGSSYTPSSTYSQPTTRTVGCPYCNGGGVVLNPYDGNYYYCQNCGGTGKVTVTTNGSNPSFTGHTGPCTNPNCPKKKEGHPCYDYRAGSSGRSNCGYCGCSSTDHGL